MKTKMMLIAFGAFFFMAGMTSCTKQWNCECKTTVAGTTTTSSGLTEKLSKSDAKTACEANNGSLAGITVDCKLK